MILFRCPSCQKGLKVFEKAAGKKVNCPMCKTLVGVPEPVAVEMPVLGNGQAGFSLKPTTNEIEQMPAGWPVENRLADIEPNVFTLAPPKPSLVAKAKSLAAAGAGLAQTLPQKVRARPKVAAIVAAVGVMALLVTAYFWFTGPPSKAIMKQVIREYVKAHGIGSTMGFGISQANVQVNTFTQLKVGRFNKEGKYWPIHALYSGSLVFVQRQMFGRPVVVTPESFTRDDLFAIYQDDFGAWKAKIISRQ